MKNYIAIDTETTGLNWFKKDRPFLVSFYDGVAEADYLIGEVDPFTREVYWDARDLIELNKLINNIDNVFIFHNASFDIHMLETIGVKFPKSFTYFDTLILAHQYKNDLPSYGLKTLAKTILNFPDDDEKDLKMSTRSARREAKKRGWCLAEDVEADYWMAYPNLVIKYALNDVIRTKALFNHIVTSTRYTQIRKLVAMEMECNRALIKMETKGIKIDFTRAEILSVYYKSIIAECIEQKHKLGFGELNTNSPKQMIEVFYKKLKAPIQYATRKKEGEKIKTPSVDKNALKRLAKEYPLAQCIIKHNSAEDELNKFILPLQVLSTEDQVIHPNYRQCGAITGRLSCTNPNLQNITNTSVTEEGVKKLARELFIPREGHVLYFPDYSQIEVWIAAFASQDKVMMDYLINGHDMHGEFNKQFFGYKPDFEDNKGLYRKKIKGLTFATLYGAGAFQLSEMGLGIDMIEAKDFIYKFFAKYSGLRAYKEALIQVAIKLGYIEDNFGRRYYIDHTSEFKTLNYMIQGSASGVMKRAIINVSKYCESIGASLLLTIHDELCIEVPKKEDNTSTMREIVKAMQGDFHTYFNMPNPFQVSMARTETNWAEKEEVVL